MKMTVSFEEVNQSISTSVSENSNDFSTSFGSIALGKDGKSAYQIALDNGFSGTEKEWLDSLHGKDGTDGENGYTPIKGTDYWTDEDKRGVAEEAAALVEMSESVWEKVDNENGVRLKGTGGSASGNLAISAGDDKTASDGTEFKSVASGDHAVAFGYGNTCSGRSTLAQGLYNMVTSNDSTAFGQRNTVAGTQAFAVGQLNEVTARSGTAMGYQNKVSNTGGVALGYKNTASGSGAVAMGDTCEASGISAFSSGYKTYASGDTSATFGFATKATGEGEVAMGKYNESTTSDDSALQTMFSFGIGTSDTERTNAFEIKQNGDVYFGETKFEPNSFATKAYVEELIGGIENGSY